MDSLVPTRPTRFGLRPQRVVPIVLGLYPAPKLSESSRRIRTHGGKSGGAIRCKLVNRKGVQIGEV